MNYENLLLQFFYGDGTFRVRASSPLVGEASASFVLPYSRAQIKFLTENSHTLNAREAQEFGTTLFESVFTSGVRDAYQRGLAIAAEQGSGLRLNLNFTELSELATLPWEYLYDSSNNRHIALSIETPIVRYLDLLDSTKPLSISTRLRILTAISDPSDFKTLNVEQEWEHLQTSLKPLLESGSIEIKRLDDAALAGLQRELRLAPYHIVHFIGHGEFDDNAQEGQLVFEDSQQQGHLVSGQQLGTILRNHNSIRVAVLNACEGAQGANQNSFGGVAQRLIQNGLPAVVAMQQVISDGAANIFTRDFYSAIAAGYPIEAAVAEARVAMDAAGYASEWSTPVLYMRASDGHLFKTDNELENDKQAPQWHKAGALYLAAGLAALVLFIGLAYVLLDSRPLLQRALGVMAGIITFLLAFFGLQGDKTLYPRLSQWIGARRPAQIGMGGLFAASVVSWGTIGWITIENSTCEPVLGCKEEGEHWFAVGEWSISVMGEPSPADQLLVSGTRRILYEKLNLADRLRGISIDSPQVSEQVKTQLDYWIEGDYQRTNKVLLTADIAGPGGAFYQALSVEGPADFSDLESDICILDLQSQLAFEILDALSIEVNEEIRQSIQNAPTDNCEALLLNNEAVSLALDGELYHAELLLREVLILDPDYSDAHSNLGWVLSGQGDIKNAIEEYKNAKELNSQNPLNYFNLGLAYELDGQFEASITEYENAIELDPAFYEAFNNLGFTYLQMGKLGLAEEALSQGLRIREYRFLRKNLGRVYLEQGDATRAVEEFQKALQLSDATPFPEAQFYLAIAYDELAMRDEACHALRQYKLIADADNTDRSQEWTNLALESSCE